MSFDILAPHYRWMELVLAGEKLQRCRTTFLDAIPAAQNVLLLGEGHGRCLVECVRRFPNARITCVDTSEPMLAEARRRLNHSGLRAPAVNFLQADALSWAPANETFDLIITNFFLDCFRPEQLERLVSRVAACATGDASWLVADFQTPARGIKRLRGRLILWTMYTFFRAVTRLHAVRLTPPDAFLERAGFRLQRRFHADWGLLHSDWWRRR